MLFGRISLDPVLEHDPPVKIDIRALFWHSERKDVIIFLRLVERVYAVSGPLVVRNHFARDHIRLAGIGFKRIDVVLDRLQIVLDLRDHLRRGVVHLLLKVRGIGRVVHKFIGCEKI